MKKICSDCNVQFEISDGEKTFFESKGFTLPRRCLDCRKKKKQQRQQEEGRY